MCTSWGIEQLVPQPGTIVSVLGNNLLNVVCADGYTFRRLDYDHNPMQSQSFVCVGGTIDYLTNRPRFSTYLPHCARKSDNLVAFLVNCQKINSYELSFSHIFVQCVGYTIYVAEVIILLKVYVTLIILIPYDHIVVPMAILGDSLRHLHPIVMLTSVFRLTDYTIFIAHV